MGRITYTGNSECPICGEGKLIRKVVNQKFSYKNKYKVIPEFEYFECDNCKEGVENDEQVLKNGKVIKEWHKSIDGFLSAEDIKKIRKVIGCTQEEMGRVLRIGAKTYSKYENSLSTPSGPTDCLLRILKENPIQFWILPEAKRMKSESQTMETKYSAAELTTPYFVKSFNQVDNCIHQASSGKEK